MGRTRRHLGLPPRRGAVPVLAGVLVLLGVSAPAGGGVLVDVPVLAGVLVLDGGPVPSSGGGMAADRACTSAVRSASCWASPASASLAWTAAFAPCAGVMPEVPMGALSSAATPFLTRSRISFFVYGISSSTGDT